MVINIILFVLLILQELAIISLTHKIERLQVIIDCIIISICNDDIQKSAKKYFSLIKVADSE